MRFWNGYAWRQTYRRTGFDTLAALLALVLVLVVIGWSVLG